MKRIKSILSCACMFAMFGLMGCYNADETFSVRREMVDVGKTNVGDSAKASFTFRNNRKEPIVITFLPECDCTTVNANLLKLGPQECGELEVKVAVENEGEFIKYIYVQATGEEDFLTIAVKGRTR